MSAEKDKDVADAKQRLADYISNLPAEHRDKSNKYQARLEAEAESHPLGMMGVILQEISTLRLDLLDNLNEAQDIASEQYANVMIDSIRYNDKKL